MNKPNKIPHKMGCDSRKMGGEIWCDCGVLQHHLLCDEWEGFLPSESELHEIWHEATKEDISLTIAKGLKAIAKRLKG